MFLLNLLSKSRFSACQFLHPLSKKLEISYFLTSNLWLLMFIALGLLVAVMTAMMQLSQTNGSPRRSWKLILFRALFIDWLPDARLLSISLSIFIFFCLNLLSGAIKTDKISVPTDQIVDSTTKLIDTSKTLIFNTKEFNWAKSAPDDSFIKRLSKKDILVIDGLSSLGRMKAMGINSFVIFGDQTRNIYLLTLLSRHANEIGSVALSLSKESIFYERLEIFQMRRSLDQEKKQFVNSR